MFEQSLAATPRWEEVKGEFGGGGGGAPAAPQTAPVSLISTQTAYLLLAVGEGEISSIDAIYFDDTIISSYTASFCYAFGTETQPILTGFSDAPETQQRGVEIILYDSPGVPSFGVPTSCAADVAYCDLTIQLQSLEEVDTTTGDRREASVGFYIFTAKDEATPYWHHLIHTIRTGRTDVPYAFTVRVPKPEDVALTDPWLINIMRASVDSANSKSFLQFTTKYRKIPDINYPYTALLGVRVEDASQLSGTIPLVSARVKGMKLVLPNNYNPITRTRTGAWTGGFATISGLPFLQYSNNLAWVIYNLLSDWHLMTLSGETYPRFLHIDKNWIAKFDFEAFAIYCDELVWVKVGTTVLGYPIYQSEPRYVCNGQWIERMEAGNFLDTFLSIGNAKLIEVEGLVSITWDRKFSDPEIDASFIFTNDNVEDGLFEYSNSHISENFTQVNMTIQDVTNRNKTLTVSVEAKELEGYWTAAGFPKPANYYTDLYGFNSTDVMVQGVTSLGAARRKARGLLWDSLENNEFVAFKTLLFGAILHIGQLIRVNDSGIRRVLTNGRVEGIAQNSAFINIDLGQAVTLIGAGVFYLSVYDNLGVVRKLLLQETSGVHSTVSVRKVGELAGVELVLAESSIWVLHSPILQKYKVVSVMQSDKGWEVAAVLYRPEKFDYVEGRWDGGVVSSTLPATYQANPKQTTLQSPTGFALEWNAGLGLVYAHWVGVAGVYATPEYFVSITREAVGSDVAGQFITTGAITRQTLQTFEWFIGYPIPALARPCTITVSVIAVEAGALPSSPITLRILVSG